jgi:Beta-propeller repeat
MKSFVSPFCKLPYFQSTVLILSAVFSVTAWAQAGVVAANLDKGHTSAKAGQTELVSNYGDVPLAFEPNQGQAENGVRFAARAKGLTVLLRDREIDLSVQSGGEAKAAELRMTYVGGTFREKPVALGKEEGISNYLSGNDPARWHTGIPNFEQVKYVGVYPGVDLLFYGNHRRLEHDFVLAPGADYRQIKVRLEGAIGADVARNGGLRVKTLTGDLTFQGPDIYQYQGKSRIVVTGQYVLTAANEFGFELGPYDKRLPVVIDPVLSYSTYLAGSGNDSGNAITVDANGNAYVTGYTTSIDFPAKHPEQGTCSGSCNAQDVFVTKLNPTGSALIYSTFVGGTQADQGNAIAVDSLGNAVVVGSTASFDFPQKNGAAVVLSSNSDHGFAFSLTPAGTAFNFSTYLGGDSQDSATGVALDTAGNVYVSGYTSSTNFPVTPGNQIGPVPVQYGGNDIFLVKLARKGKVAFATLVGGTSNSYIPTFPSQPVSVSVDASGEAVLGGSAFGGFPTTTGAFQANYPGALYERNNAFIGKLNATGTAFVAATYLGGTLGDAATQVVVDSSGNVYVAGTTSSSDFPTTPGAFQPVDTQPDYAISFIAKLNPALSSLVYSTYLEGTGSAYGTGIWLNGLAVDNNGNSYVTGYAGQSDFPVASPFLSESPTASYSQYASAAFVSVLNPTGSNLTFSTYFGGSTGSAGNGIAVDQAAHAVITGSTQDSNFPTSAGSFQSTIPPNLNYQSHAFVAEFLMNQGNASVCLPGNSIVLTSVAGKPSAIYPLKVTNCGTIPLTIAGLTSTNPVFTVTSVGCKTVAAGGSCTLRVKYVPSASSQFNDTGTLQLVGNTPISPAIVNVTGYIERPGMSLYGGNGENFGDEIVGVTSPALYLQLQNTGQIPLHITAVTATGSFTGVNRCPKALQPSDYCQIGATFTPTAAGPAAGTVYVYDDAAGSPQQAIFVTGNGISTYPAPSQLFMSPNVAPVGSLPVPVYIDGQDVFSTSTLEINGKPFTGKVVYSFNALQFTLPASMLKQLGSLSIQVVNPAPGGASAPLSFSVYRQTALGAADMVYEPFSQKFYASIPAASPTNPNSLVTIDPNTGAVGSPIPIGNDPGALGLSDDGQILYVALNGDHAIVPFKLATQTAGAEIPLGSDPAQGPLHAVDIQVQPGDSGTLVATLSTSAYYGSDGVALIENGQVLSEYLNDPPNSVAVGGTRFVGSSDLYGWDTGYASAGLLHFVIDGNQLLQAPGISSSYGLGPFDSIGTNLYDINGQVFSATTGSLEGTITNFGGAFGVLADAGSNRVFFLSGGAQVFDATALTLVGYVAGPNATTPRAQKWGPDGLAYLTYSNSGSGQDLVQLSSNLFSSSAGPNPVPAVAALSPSMVTSGGPNFVLTLTGSQFVAGAVVQWNGSNRTTRFVDAGTLVVDIPASDIAVPGTAKITVTNPAPGGGKSGAVKLGIS